MVAKCVPELTSSSPANHQPTFKMKSFCVAALFVISSVLAVPVYESAAPAYGGHGGGHGGAAHGPVSVHTYAAKAPAVKCGANLLVGCAPHVAHVPCVPSHGGYGGHAAGGYGGHAAGGYGGHGASHGGYAAPAAHGGYAAPAAHGGYAAPAPAYGGGHGGYRASDSDDE